jgi:ParB/RepB/Spo0J family partition protein
MVLPPKQLKSIPVAKVVVSAWETRKDPHVDDVFVESCRDGLMNPIAVWYESVRDVYQLVAGQRRTLATRKLGKETIDAFVFDGPLTREQALVFGWKDNKHRADLTYDDEADAVEQFAVLTGAKNVEIATEFGISQASVTRLRRYSNGPGWLKEMVRAGMARSTADALLESNNSELIQEVAAQVGPKGLKRDDVKRALRGDKPKRSKKASVVLARPGKPAVILRGVAIDTPLQQATELVRELLADLVKAAKTQASLGDAVKAWRLAGG